MLIVILRCPLGSVQPSIVPRQSAVHCNRLRRRNFLIRPKIMVPPKRGGLARPYIAQPMCALAPAAGVHQVIPIVTFAY
jgi:hypothetical protein